MTTSTKTKSATLRALALSTTALVALTFVPQMVDTASSALRDSDSNTSTDFLTATNWNLDFVPGAVDVANISVPGTFGNPILAANHAVQPIAGQWNGRADN